MLWELISSLPLDCFEYGCGCIDASSTLVSLLYLDVDMSQVLNDSGENEVRLKVNELHDGFCQLFRSIS